MIQDKPSNPTQQNKSSFISIGSLFDKYQAKENGKYISQEFQDYGYRLAVDLNDLPHKSLYIKLAKREPRAWLEQARRFVIDASSAKSKAKLFMWKLGQLKKAEKPGSSS